MNRFEKILLLRQSIASGHVSIGSWMQISHASVAEIMGQAGYDWVAVDLEHGSISIHQLPDIFRSLELGGTLPLVRLAQGHPKDCKQALDAGAGGVIVPMVESADQLEMVRNACRWPPSGNRGVGFSRANLFGKYFESYKNEAQAPLLVAMIENINGLSNLDSILKVKGLDAILIGPYDLSASMGMTANFDNPDFISAIDNIKNLCTKNHIPSGIHIVHPNPGLLTEKIKEGYRFIAYSLDTVFLYSSSENPRRFSL
jgi:2-dehydro-3-deoxyglucarate aldolase